MQKILLFGAGKSATCLIQFLEATVTSREWQLVVAESNLQLANSKLGNSHCAKAVQVSVEDQQQRDDLIREASIVISLLPPALHFLVAASCIQWKKHLLTASYLDDKIKALEPAIRDNGLLFLCEMGLDPGIDHMSAMQLIHGIQHTGGRIHYFRSHTGGLVSPVSDNNPWHYKISWNPRNVVLAGAAGAKYLENGQVVSRTYKELFRQINAVKVKELASLAWYPNRDSLSYIPVYGLEGISTFIRTTLRYPDFIKAWDPVIQAGLTDDSNPITQTTVAQWSAAIEPLINETNRPQLEYLGLFDNTPIPVSARTSADVLQYLLETRLAMAPGDKDMIVMLHELAYTDAEGRPAATSSSLVVHGEDHLRTAMAKTVGLPLGIAAVLILDGKIKLRGLHIPILPEIYTPVMEDLARQGIHFKDEHS
ncbi:saccharopine dehydrogenase C-terminal domain-containing protein [Flavitalea sp. BT771]|uniref:saccharopine dehydrogenase C-terminal domain-containing protein n=1 Tax=Flavitalea sp. BT771 TaxID=3063329 RepID=UPI0026E19F67|nr:saccharopine dehydrogenase C-terminal domain-containing protein [Flavitalea sp. BT771]MDO6434504.1 saccharopine dehydrogenase C-terminal domain-containing protein [Flavitalea sp. BT771]MDV6223404.1 saccharopine dehydrogenase C-terminal domain-containing protein [Flavitalea sp. BT771]